MSYLRLGLRGVLPATVLLSLFSGVLRGQAPFARGELLVTTASLPSENYRYSGRSCQAVDLELRLGSSELGEGAHPICETLPTDTPNALPCASGPVRASWCDAEADTYAKAALVALGKKGQSIATARAKVLEILDSNNACTAWFQKREPDPAHIFRTLSFSVDAKSPEYVIERMEGGGNSTFVNPYVATVVQGGGEFQTVTLNAGGAFFHPSATLVRLAKEGGPIQFQGGRALRVGPYVGDTLQAQVTTLLHELGHVLELLPLDTNDANGLSVANTREVLRQCQAEIEPPAKHRLFSASR